jgi:hypothetical protein
MPNRESKTRKLAVAFRLVLSSPFGVAIVLGIAVLLLEILFYGNGFTGH